MRTYARAIVAVFGIVFAGFVASQFRRAAPAAGGAPVVRTDPAAVVESTKGDVHRFKISREDVRVSYEKSLAYADGTSKLIGATIVTENRAGGRSFTITAREAKLGQNESTIGLDGDVQLKASDGFTAKTEHATYAEVDDSVAAPGPVEFSRGRMSGDGTGLKYEKARDMLSILDRAHVRVAPDGTGGGAAEITAATVTYARRDKYLQFERDVRIDRGGQVTQADLVLAHLSADEQRIESIELHTNARITGAPDAAAGALQALAGHDMNLSYRADGESLEHALISGDAVLRLAGERGKAGRQISAKMLDIQLAPDGTTPVNLAGRDSVQLTMPAEPGVPERTITSTNIDAKGEPGQGLTRASFTGGVKYRERGDSIDRAAVSSSLDVALKPGMATIDEARFAHGVRFEEGKMLAQAAAARYDVNKGTLQLSGSEPAALLPRVINEQVAVDAAKLDITLDGPQVKAAGTVKSTIKPSRPGANESADPKAAGGGRGAPVTKMPAMLKQDQPATVLADALAYDGTKSFATYTGNARLFQGDTTVKGDTIVLDQTKGDMIATGHVVSTSIREHVDKDNKKQRSPSTVTAGNMKYEDEARRLVYTGGAHMVGPEGDLTATRIELYLNASGDDVERAEAFTDAGEKLTLREQNRTTTGSRMTYTADRETYVVVGRPAVVVDECGRETTGGTLTFVRSTDTITVDGNQQIRTTTKGGSGKCP